MVESLPKKAQEQLRRQLPAPTVQETRADVSTCLATEQLMRELECINPDQGKKE